LNFKYVVFLGPKSWLISYARFQRWEVSLPVLVHWHGRKC